jgi:U11/U12 small nuclear ribonucleoprotein SNRNP35
MNTAEETIKEKFAKFGKIRKCTLVRDLITGRSKCYAFVEYKHRSDCREAFERGHHMVIDEARIIVEKELERTLDGWKPRRLGGGFGGKKESGQLRFGGRERPFKRPM